MNRRLGRRTFLGLGAAASVAVVGTTAGSAAFSGIDQDFESVSVGGYPSGWVKDGATDQAVVDDRAHSGSRSLRLTGSHGGCWQAIANAPIGGHPGETEVRFSGSVLPGAAGSFGCHDKYYARVQLRTDAGGGWSDGSSRSILTMRRDGTLSAPGGVTVGTFSPGDWVSYDITYQYDAGADEITLEYEIDGGSSGGTTTVSAASWETDISYLTLRSGDFTTYWDSVTAKPVGGGNQVPNAAFQYAPESPTVRDEVVFDASDASDADGSIVGYAWDLDGDGDYDATGETVVHSYDNSGEYPVSLRVTDDDGATAVASTTVAVGSGNTAPSASFQVAPQSPIVGDSLTLDASDASDADGSIVGYAWDLDGDGDYDATGRVVEHTYESSGTYEIGLRVTDDDGATDRVSRSVSIGEPENRGPTAGFEVSPSPPVAGTATTFDASAATDPDGSIAAYEWDFGGDGSVDATGQTVEHTFEEAGDATVALRVSDDDGAVGRVERTFSVAKPENKPPSAVFDSSTAEPQAGETVRFDASASTDPDGEIKGYRWDLTGDGTRDATGRTVEYTYESPGEYTVTLTVVDAAGATATSRGTVTVTESPLSSVKAAHLKTAKRVDEISVANLGATAKAQRANRAFTDAVDRGDLDIGTAIDAIRRLDSGLSVTEHTLEHIGGATELSSNRVDLAQEMAMPTINTSMELLLTVVSIAKKISKGVGLGTKAVLATAKSKAKDAVKTILTSMLGRGIDAMSKIDYEANTIVGEIVSGSLDTVAAVNDAVEAAAQRVVDSVSTSIQYYAEARMGAGVAPLVGSFIGATTASLAAGLEFFYGYLSPERVVENGLRGDTNAATSATIDASHSIANEAEDTQALIRDAKEFGESFSLTESVYRLWNDPSLWEVAKTIGSVVLFVAGGIVNAFATGGGIGALVKINVTHHLGLFNAIRG
ncbi:PKD domain-containing protein [Halobaculum gomorrense]|uniref:PKD repeat-containing protein n=1 Tax=Halobaculum gomorrense TaxID=43928 RepID=A0A1M5NWP3_9EURY|nr:PKD domain-containing protein [Halobaculum gomorrense]SHG93917.1 PKD repeat-containing protein [Halobaculum gomorrense]